SPSFLLFDCFRALRDLPSFPTRRSSDLVALPEDLRAQVAAACDIIDVPVGQSIAAALDAQQAQQVRGILCTVRSRIDEPLLAALPALRVASNFAVGFDNVDVAAATARDVLICNTPKVLDGAVADLTLGLVL